MMILRRMDGSMIGECHSIAAAVDAEVDLTGANLSSAALSEATRTGANLSSADLTGATLRLPKIVEMERQRVERRADTRGGQQDK